MLKIKNFQIDQEAIDVINELLDKKISIVAAFKLSRMVKELNEVIKSKTEAEVKLINRFAKKTESGDIKLSKNDKNEDIPNTFEIENDKLEEFSKEMNELMMIETDINYNPIGIEELKMEENETFTAKKIMKIDFLFS
jgi:anionic cell wall polymer biosynthesis LytR-Cps2A-Psr (LCP) family protein